MILEGIYIKKKKLVNEEFFCCERKFHRLSLQMAYIMVYLFCQKHFFQNNVANSICFANKCLQL